MAVMDNQKRKPAAKFLIGVICESDQPTLPVIEDFADGFVSSPAHVTQYPFVFTDYYEAEFGNRLVRHWFTWDKLENPARIREWKRRAMAIESRYETDAGKRRFNLDPGYVTGAKFVLGSRKNHAHRIYLGDGVYAEVTLRFENGGWRTMPKSYPEFQGDQNLEWLNDIRSQWKQAVNEN